MLRIAYCVLVLCIECEMLYWLASLLPFHLWSDRYKGSVPHSAIQQFTEREQTIDANALHCIALHECIVPQGTFYDSWNISWNTSLE